MHNSKIIRKFERFLFKDIPEQPEHTYERDGNPHVSMRQTGKSRADSSIDISDDYTEVGKFVYDFENGTETYISSLPVESIAIQTHYEINDFKRIALKAGISQEVFSLMNFYQSPNLIWPELFRLAASIGPNKMAELLVVIEEEITVNPDLALIINQFLPVPYQRTFVERNNTFNP